MDPFNQKWSENAAVLVVVLGRKIFEITGLPSKTHSYDVGAACQNLALQGSILGLVVHAIEGFDYERSREVLDVPDDYSVEVMFAVGHLGNTEDLPEKLREQERPSGRKMLHEIAFEGTFKK